MEMIIVKATILSQPVSAPIFDEDDKINTVSRNTAEAFKSSLPGPKTKIVEVNLDINSIPSSHQCKWINDFHFDNFFWNNGLIQLSACTWHSYETETPKHYEMPTRYAFWLDNGICYDQCHTVTKVDLEYNQICIDTIAKMTANLSSIYDQACINSETFIKQSDECQQLEGLIKHAVSSHHESTDKEFIDAVANLEQAEQNLASFIAKNLTGAEFKTFKDNRGSKIKITEEEWRISKYPSDLRDNIISCKAERDRQNNIRERKRKDKEIVLKQISECEPKVLSLRDTLMNNCNINYFLVKQSANILDIIINAVHKRLRAIGKKTDHILDGYIAKRENLVYPLEVITGYIKKHSSSSASDVVLLEAIFKAEYEKQNNALQVAVSSGIQYDKTSQKLIAILENGKITHMKECDAAYRQEESDRILRQEAEEQAEERARLARIPKPGISLEMDIRNFSALIQGNHGDEYACDDDEYACEDKATGRAISYYDVVDRGKIKRGGGDDSTPQGQRTHQPRR